MNVALLIVSFLTLLAAGAAAIFAFPAFHDWLTRPDLALQAEVTGHSFSGGSGFVDVDVRLVNRRGRAGDWKVVLASTGNYLQLRDDPSPGEQQGATPGEGWRIDWQAAGSSDLVGSGDRSLRCRTTPFGSTQKTVARFTLSATRMDQRSGEIQIGWHGAEAIVDVAEDRR